MACRHSLPFDAINGICAAMIDRGEHRDEERLETEEAAEGLAFGGGWRMTTDIWTAAGSSR